MEQETQEPKTGSGALRVQGPRYREGQWSVGSSSSPGLHL